MNTNDLKNYTAIVECEADRIANGHTLLTAAHALTDGEYMAVLFFRLAVADAQNRTLKSALDECADRG